VDSGELYSLSNLRIPKHLNGLLQYMHDNNKLEAIENYNPKLLSIMSDDVLSKIKANASHWEDDLPEEVVKAIKYYELFGFHQPKEPSAI
jgi:hypothetical protein